MPDQPSLASHVRRSAMLTGAVLAAAGALAGATGVARMEYRARPWGHAIMIAWSAGIYGLLIGAVLGLVTFPLQRWWYNRQAKNRTNGA